MKVTGFITDIRKIAVHDGSGIATTVFLKGCPMRCLWCHSPEARSDEPVLAYYADNCVGCGQCIEVCPTGALSQGNEGLVINRAVCQVCGACAEVCSTQALVIQGRTVTVEEIMAEMEKDRPFYENPGSGLTISGGEPTHQLQFVKALLKAAKEAGIHTCVETCGYSSWSAYEDILPFTDLVLYDIKSLNSQQHRQHTGRSNAVILQNLQTLTVDGIYVLVHTHVVPGFNDTIEEISAIASFLSSLDNVPPLKLLPSQQLINKAKFERLGMEYPFGDVQPTTHELMQELAEVVKRHGVECTIGS